MQPCIAIDWLTLHVKVPVRDYERLDSRYRLKKADEQDLKRISDLYKLEKQEYQTRHFRAVYIIVDHTGEEVATLAAQPHSQILEEDSGLFKIHNKFLYQQDLLKYAKNILKDLQLEFRSISRIDIAVDFLTFAKGLKPENFIKGFTQGKYQKKGKKSKFKMQGETGSFITYESLKFGSETSDVTYYLYNKSKEMEDVKMKGWIQDHWRANGWDGKANVWRLEFSLKPSTKEIIDPESGELIFSFRDLNVMEKIEEVFSYNFKKYFSFVQGKTKCRKDRMKPVLLFPERMKCKHVCIKVSEKKEALRSDKIFAKKLMTLNQELRGHDFELAIYNAELLGYHVLSRNLTAWAEKKLPGFQISDKQASRHAAEMFTMQSQPGQQRIRLLNLYRYHGNYPVGINPYFRKQ